MNSFTTVIGAALAGATLAWLSIGILLRTGLGRKIAVDHPNHRSLHQGVIPRVGGLGLVGAGLISASLWSDSQYRVVLSLTLGLMLVSAIDDRRGLPVAARLLAHAAAAAVAVVMLLPNTPGWVQLLLALAIIWATNLYNFMDGSDGLAGGMAAIGFGTLALAAAGSAGTNGLAIAAAAFAGAALGFLVHNFPPARVFLGDAGSIPLGFLAAALGLSGWAVGAWPAWLPVLVFSPFIADASATLLWRLLRGERVWQAHNEHAYQRMVKGGLGHRRTALLWYGVMLACAASALLAISWPFRWQIALLAGWAVFYAGVFGMIRRMGCTESPTVR